jgi:hypothetical protein
MEKYAKGKSMQKGKYAKGKSMQKGQVCKRESMQKGKVCKREKHAKGKSMQNGKLCKWKSMHWALAQKRGKRTCMFVTVTLREECGSYFPPSTSLTLKRERDLISWMKKQKRVPYLYKSN